MAIAAGTLTERITLQKATVTRNSIGEEVAGWTDITTDLPAAVRWLKGSRALTFGDVWNPATVKITCRYREVFEEAERILWHGKEFTVVSSFGDRVNMSMTITADLYHEGKNEEDPEPEPPVPVYLTAWKIVGNSEMHTDPFLTSWKVSGNSIVDNNAILSCGDLGQDGKYHVKISNGVTIYDIPLDAPLRKVNDIADTIEFPSNAEGKALVTRNLKSVDMGTLEYIKRADVGEALFAAPSISDYKYTSECAGLIAGLTQKPSVSAAITAAQTLRDNEWCFYYIGSHSGVNVYIRIMQYINYTAKEFASAMIGKEFIYELDTPTTELIDVSPFAVSPTDTYTSSNVAPFSAFEYTENKEIWSCGEYNATDGKYHVVVLPIGKQAVDIVLDEPLHKVNDIADTLEYPLGISGKALLTTRVAEIDGELTPLVTPTIALVDVPQIEESTEYSNVITPGSKAVEWSELSTDPEKTT